MNIISGVYISAISNLPPMYLAGLLLVVLSFVTGLVITGIEKLGNKDSNFDDNNIIEEKIDIKEGNVIEIKNEDNTNITVTKVGDNLKIEKSANEEKEHKEENDDDDIKIIYLDE